MEKFELQGRSAPLAVRRVSSPLPSAPTLAQQPAHSSTSSPGKRKGRRSLPAGADCTVRQSPSGAELDGASALIEKTAERKGKGATGEEGASRGMTCCTDVVSKGAKGSPWIAQDGGLPGTSELARSPVNGVASASVQEEAGSSNSAGDVTVQEHTGSTVSQQQAGTMSDDPAVVSEGLVPTSKEPLALVQLSSGSSSSSMWKQDRIEESSKCRSPTELRQDVAIDPAPDSDVGVPDQAGARTDSKDGASTTDRHKCDHSEPDRPVLSRTGPSPQPTAPKTVKSNLKDLTNPLRRSASSVTEVNSVRPPRSKSLESRQKAFEAAGRVSSPPCSPRLSAPMRMARSRSLPGPHSTFKTAKPKSPVVSAPNNEIGPSSCLTKEASIKGELASQSRPSPVSPCKSTASPKAQKLKPSANGRETAATVPLSPRISSQATGAKARVLKPAKPNPSSEPGGHETAPVSSPALLSPVSKTKPRSQPPGIHTHVAHPDPPSTSPTKPPRGVLTPQPLQLASPLKHPPNSPGTLSPPGPTGPPKALSPRGALSPTGGVLRDPPRPLRRSSALSSSAESEPGAGSPPTSPESAARAEALRHATQLRLEKWRAEQEASALKAKRLEDTKREEERRRRETALELKEKRRAEIYALNHKLREEEEQRVDAYRRERERRDRESGANAAATAPLRLLAPSMSGHHMAA